ncbi:uncharacterized protein RJT20DRAFT_32464 [Scheffersomyces xylosifermentans]|uniref:uncharacterized protein n=1 Tax=Scheffersomyces xylosifermentans TaxID=1304137 RepID=UPI00315C5266
MDTRQPKTLSNRNFVNSFWGRNDVGFQVIQTKSRDSLNTLQELLDFYQERITIEKEYTKRLEKLSQKHPLGSRETGSLKKSMDKLNIENEQMIKYNQKFIKSLNQINYSKIYDFYKLYSKKVAKIDHHMTKIIARRSDALKEVEHSKSRYQLETSQLKSLRLAMKTTWGKELERNEVKFNKLSASISNSRSHYQVALTNYRELNEIYIRDWSIALQDFYKLEIERIQICKVNCFNYCNNIATLCVENDQSADLARSVFAQIQPAADLKDFSDAYGTGDKIYSEPKFIDFMNGFDDTQEKEEFTRAKGQDPEYAPILSRTYSTYSSESSQVAAASNQTPNIPPVTRQQQPHTTPHPARSPTRKAPTEAIPIEIKHTKTQSSAYSSSPEDNRADVFSIHERKEQEKFTNSNGSASSNYSNPTNYTSSNYSTGSNGQRHWASPRRTEKQLSQFQEQINRKSKELPALGPTVPNLEAPKNVPIMKDFSIDFIAKALEDLNSGGNGDVNQFRRSVRRAQKQDNQQHEDVQRSVSKAHSNGTLKPGSDFVDDHDEVATRYGSINFSSPPTKSKFTHNLRNQRPKSMLLPSEDTNQTLIATDAASLSTCIVKGKRKSMSSLPTKSYSNLHLLANDVTPGSNSSYVTKARARYSYKPQQQGELYFRKGWNMYVIHKQEDNWYLCELAENCLDRAGMVGLVPGNYLVEGDDIF